MLLPRLITALLLIPPVLAAVWFLPTPWLVLLFGAFTMVGAWEWTALMKLQSPLERAGYVLLVGLLGLGSYAGLQNPAIAQGVLLLAALWWLAAFMWILQYPKGLPENERRVPLKAVVGLLVLVPAIPSIALLHGRFGPAWVLVLFLVIWAADTGAYFAGRSLGRHKLAPRVSPGKTWEGFVGGVIAGAAIGVIAALLFAELNIAYWLFGACCAVVVMASVVGDLTESMFKRHASIKDSGTLFPGHGGVLDRLDSLFAATPIFVLLLQMLAHV